MLLLDLLANGGICFFHPTVGVVLCTVTGGLSLVERMLSGCLMAPYNKLVSLKCW